MNAILETNRLAASAEPPESETIRLDLAPQRNTINISPETVTEATAKMAADEQLLIRWLYGYARAENLSWEQLEGSARVNRNTLYKIWTGKYTDAQGKPVGLGSVCETIARFKRLAGEREHVTRADFVETGVSKRIFKVCDEARVLQIIAMIYGESQIGKTAALQAYTQANNHGQTIYFRLPASSSEFFKELARACFISTKNPLSKIRDKLFRSLDHTKVLIVDELHLAFEIYSPRAIMRTMETLREVHDLTRCGLVLCGTNVFRDEMKNGDHARMLKQLMRRGIYELQLPSIAPQADVDALAAAYKLKPATGEAADLVKLIVTRDGLGKFCKYLAKASQMAAKHKDTLKWEHFVKVHTLLLKLSTFE